MASLNQLELIGNLGDDPDTKFTQGGVAITKIRMATTSVRKDRDGNRIERTQWHRVTLFGRLAEVAGEYLRKGSQVYIRGEVCYSEREADGVKRYYTDIEADRMVLLGRNESSTPAPSRNRQATERPARQERADAARSDAFGDFVDDDIPF